MFLHAVKTLGQPGQVFGADFGAFVIDGNSNGFACRHFVAFGKGDGRSLADADFDFALADAVFDRIVGQVLQQLADLGFVGGNLGNVVFKVNFDFYLAFGSFL